MENLTSYGIHQMSHQSRPCVSPYGALCLNSILTRFTRTLSLGNTAVPSWCSVRNTISISILSRGYYKYIPSGMFPFLRYSAFSRAFLKSSAVTRMRRSRNANIPASVPTKVRITQTLDSTARTNGLDIGSTEIILRNHNADHKCNASSSPCCEQTLPDLHHPLESS